MVCSKNSLLYPGRRVDDRTKELVGVGVVGVVGVVVATAVVAVAMNCFFFFVLSKLMMLH